MSNSNQSLREIFNEALEIDDAQQRREYLAQACGADSALLQSIVELIQADEAAGRFLGLARDSIQKPASHVRGDDAHIEGPHPSATRRFGDYQLLGKIARGGMGVVYRARHVALDRTVALKMIASGHLASPTAVQRFRAEAEAAAQLDHPNIVPVFEVGEQDGQHFFTMKLVEGRSLAEHIREGDFRIPSGDTASWRAGMRRIAELMRLVAEAVHYAHQRGILHRDLKPGNILLDGAAQPHVTDFGLAKRVEAESHLTASGDIMGTPAYMAPEQAAGRMRQMTTTADVYSLGVIFYELLAGRVPFRGTTAMEVLDQVRHSEPTPPRVANASIPRDLETICLKCLEKDPSKRYGTAHELAEELSRYLRDEPIFARPVAPAEKLWRWCRRKPALAGLGAVVLLLLLAGALGGAAFVLHIRRQNIEITRAQQQAIQERNTASTQRDRALDAQQEARDVLKFFEDHVLAAARPEEQHGGLGHDVTLRAAIDAAEPMIALAFTNRPLAEASIRGSLGTTYSDLGVPAAAVRQAELELALRRSAQGEDHVDTLTTASGLGGFLEEAGRAKEAVQLLESTRERVRKKYGTDSGGPGNLINNLALSYLKAGRLTNALPLFEGELTRRKMVLGTNHPSTLISMNNLAHAYSQAGNYDKTLPLLKEVLRVRQSTLGPENPALVLSMNNLGESYLKTGKTNEGTALLEEALRIARIKLGPDHVKTLTSSINLASCLLAMGRIAEAMLMLEETVARCGKRLGPQASLTIVARGSLADCYHKGGRLTNEMALRQETVSLLRNGSGPSSPQMFEAIQKLAGTLWFAGRKAEALPLYEEAVQRQTNQFGLEHPNTLPFLENLGNIYSASDRLEDAVRVHETRLRMCQAQLGPEHRETLRALNDLADADLDLGRWTEAESLAREALRGIQNAARPSRSLLAKAQRNLGEALVHQDKTVEAEPLLRAFIAIMETQKSEGTSICSVRGALGAVLMVRKEFHQAQQLLLQAHDGLQKLEERNPLRSRAQSLHSIRQWLAENCEALGQPGQAAAWRRMAGAKPLE